MEKLNYRIEILIMGIVSFIGIFLSTIGFLNIKLNDVLSITNNLGDYSNIVLVALLAISYQLGWLVNGFSHKILPSIYYKKIHENVLQEKAKDYSKIRDYVNSNAKSSSITKIRERLSGIRLLRSGMVNTAIFILGFISLGWYQAAGLLVPIFIIFSFVTYNYYKDYTTRIVNTYNQICKKKNKK